MNTFPKNFVNIEFHKRDISADKIQSILFELVTFTIALSTTIVLALIGWTKTIVCLSSDTSSDETAATAIS